MEFALTDSISSVSFFFSRSNISFFLGKFSPLLQNNSVTYILYGSPGQMLILRIDSYSDFPLMLHVTRLLHHRGFKRHIYPTLTLKR